jgi:two-component system phosphate regulon sensor histidine kinase PhoR
MNPSNPITDNSSVRSISEELYKKNKEINDTLLETKELANQLGEEKKKIEIILENIIDVVIYVDDNSKILLVNKAFEREFDLKKEDVLGKELQQILSFDDDIKKLNLSELELLAPNKNQQTKITHPIKISSTKTIYGTVGISVITNEENKKRTIYTIHNKTKEHELENMKLDFVSMAAHELRTPITSIRGYTSLMSEELEAHENLPSDDWKVLLGRISMSSEQLLALVENLLNVTKIEKGIMSLACKAEDWNKSVSILVEDFQERAKSKKINLTVRLPSVTIFAYVDKLRIEEVLINLLSNAITFTPSGGNITVEIQKKDQLIYTSVKDNGPGISKESQKHLFEKFFRVSGPLEQGSKGNGLGLYIAKSIVEMHGGRIWVESDTGLGCNFVFSIPVLEEKPSSN